MLFSVILVLILAVPVSASRWTSDENGCWIDSYGCFLHDENGMPMYIMFWSEEARAYFMGDKTDPYENVTMKCYDCQGQLKLENSASEGSSSSGFDWKSEYERMLTLDNYSPEYAEQIWNDLADMEKSGASAEDFVIYFDKIYNAVG